MLYFLQGTESFLFDQELAKIAQEAQVATDDIVYYSANETDFSTFVLEMNSDDLFGADKLIVLKDLEQQKVGQYLAGVDDHVVQLLRESRNILVIHFWREDALSKTLQQELAALLKAAKVIDTKKQKESAVIDFIKQTLKTRTHTVTSQDMKNIAQKYQNNLALIHNEIERIFLEKKAEEAITADDFKTASQFLEEQVFDLIEVLEHREVEQTFNILDNILLHQQNVFGLLALLLKNYKEMYQMQALSNAGYTLAQITTRLSMHPYRAKLLYGKAKGLNEIQYQFILNKIISTEIELKTGAQQTLALRELLTHILNIQTQ